MASDDGDTTPNRLRHPAKLWPNSWLFHDRSDQPEMLQVIDLLHDIRTLLLAIFIVLLILR